MKVYWKIFKKFIGKILDNMPSWLMMILFGISFCSLVILGVLLLGGLVELASLLLTGASLAGDSILNLLGIGLVSAISIVCGFMLGKKLFYELPLWLAEQWRSAKSDVLYKMQQIEK